MTATKLLKISLIILISLCFITTFSFMTACKDDAISTLDKEAKYLVYCHTDSASIPGAQMLVDAGFMTVYRVEGNYAA